jgi:hypothetical protein
LKRIIVSDATPVIAFSRINRLKLLQEVVREIIIPEEVSSELFKYKKSDIKSLKNYKWIRVEKITSQNNVELLLPTLDRGEAEVIILSKELKADLVIIDELSARKVAMMMDLPLIGTVGLLIAAKENKLIEKVKPLLDEMIVSGIRYGEEFYRKVLAEIGELS